MYGKLGIIVLLTMSDPRIAFWYVFACCTVWLVVSRPVFKGDSAMLKPNDENELGQHLDLEKVFQ
jgi:hypothetical protein